uniref:Matrilin 4 n=1 Tax=Panthera tigris altaica TaxID=74533 RepID=A0A8C9KR44_PANTA
MRGLLCSPLPMLLLLLQPSWESQLQFAGPRCRTGPLDLVFVIDSSRSVRPFEFETMRQFLVGLLRGLDVGPNATRVGVIQYSSQVQSVFRLGAFSRREDMERAIRALVPLAQGTMTGLAIQYAMNVAAQARARGIEIYAVGVQRADVGSLRAMASPPLDEHVFLVESFDLIQEFGLQFQGRLCAIDLCAEGTHGCEHHCISSPGSYSCRCRAGFVLQQDQRSCRAIDHCSFGNHSCQHECVSTFRGPRCHCREGHDLLPDGRSCQARDLCNGVDHGCEFQCVSEGLSYRCLCPEGQQLQADGKSCNRECRAGGCSVGLRPTALVPSVLGSEGLHTWYLLYNNRLRMNDPGGGGGGGGIKHSCSEAQGARPRALNVPRVGLVFTDGRSQDDISVWAARAKEEGIVMYAVGVGKAVEEELRQIASEPAELHVSYSPDFGSMTHLLENLRGSICPEEGIGAGTELRSPCECESLVEFQGRTLGLAARLEDLENQLASQK